VIEKFDDAKMISACSCSRKSRGDKKETGKKNTVDKW